MKTRTEFSVWGTFLLMLLVTVLLFNVMAFGQEQEQEQTIVGTVVETERNDDGEVVAVAIQVVSETKGEEGDPEQVIEDYLVADTDKGRELINLVGEQVKATGVIKADENGEKTIFVTKFSKVKSDETSKSKKEKPPERQ